MFKISQRVSDPGSIISKPVLTQKGHMCGAEFINRRFRRWLESPQYLRSPNELSQQAQILGISVENLLESACNQFENLKVDYNSYIPVYSISITGKHGGEYKIRFDRLVFKTTAEDGED